MKKAASLFCLSALLLAAPAQADDLRLPAEAGDWWRQPDLTGFSAGMFGVTRNMSQYYAADFRVEERWGVSLLPKIAPVTFSGWDPYFQIRPLAGAEFTSRGGLYGYGGFVFDLFLGKHFFFSPSETVGLYYKGDGKRLGAPIEFRSTGEFGYRFDNNARVSVSIGHISNAKISEFNPGVEIASVNVFIPTNWIFKY